MDLSAVGPTLGQYLKLVKWTQTAIYIELITCSGVIIVCGLFDIVLKKTGDRDKVRKISDYKSD